MTLIGSVHIAQAYAFVRAVVAEINLLQCEDT